jgi:hypothetical protein
LLSSLIHAIGTPTIGENFDPAKDCSDIVDNLPKAKDGFYWIALGKNKVQKVNSLFL